MKWNWNLRSRRHVKCVVTLLFSFAIYLSPGFGGLMITGRFDDLI